MRKIKSFITASAAMGVVAAGLTLMPSPAQAIYCRPTMIPAGYYPTGASCSLGCESELLINRQGSTFCAILGPGIGS